MDLACTVQGSQKVIKRRIMKSMMIDDDGDGGG
jgi:hypothetical protein